MVRPTRRPSQFGEPVNKGSFDAYRGSRLRRIDLFLDCIGEEFRPHRGPRHLTKGPPAAAAYAAFDPTGHEQSEGQNSVAWLREQQYFSSQVWAGSEAPER